jgi:hypothetical protein
MDPFINAALSLPPTLLGAAGQAKHHRVLSAIVDDDCMIASFRKQVFERDFHDAFGSLRAGTKRLIC